MSATRTLGTVILATLSAACWSPPDRIATLRPLTLQVVDARSKRPVEGVPVIYVVEVRVLRDRFLGFIPSLEPQRSTA